MLTGTPLDLTPFGPLLSALGLAYWILALGLVGLAPWALRRWRVKVTPVVGAPAACAYPVMTDDRVIRSAGDDRAQGGPGNDNLDGLGCGDGNDSLFGDVSRERLASNLGGRQTDSLNASTANATLSGGRGNDTLTGSGGRNNYLYGSCDGADRIIDNSAKTDAQGAAAPNRIVFGEGISAGDLTLRGAQGAMRLQVGTNADDSVTPEGFDQGSASAAPMIDQFEFADGTVLSYAQLVPLGFDGSEGGDEISGTSSADRVDGHAGNDLNESFVGLPGTSSNADQYTIRVRTC